MAMQDQEAYRHLQASGRKKLRITAILFLLFFIICSALSYLLLKELFPFRYGKELSDYALRLLIESGIWLVISFQLWKIRRSGRWLFLIAAIVSFYFIKDIPAFFQISVEGSEAQMLRILYLSLMISKYMILITLSYHLFHDEAIGSIWKAYQKPRIISEEDQMDAAARAVLREAQLVAMEEDGRVMKKAQRFLHRYTFSLVVITFGTMVVYWLLLFLMPSMFPKDVDGLEYVQRMLLLFTLFTALIWSFLGVAMFLYSRLTCILLPLIWLLEIINLINQIPDLVQTFQTQHYQLPSLVTFLLLEILRYALLVKLSLHILHNPFLKALWKSRQLKNRQQGDGV